MSRPSVLLCLLLVLFQPGAALAQSTRYSVPEGNVIEDRIPDEELAPGEVRVRVYPGYRDEQNDIAYAFPVGNAALGRAWASGDELRWQVGFGYSVIPLLVQVDSRSPSAQRIRIEAWSTHPYAREELQNYNADSPEMLRRQLALFSGEFLVPPSVPTSFVLTPRYIPDVAPNSRVDLEVFVYLNDQRLFGLPHELDVTTLEPAHLYYLHLDGPPGSPQGQAVNADNQLGLGLPAGDRLDPSVLSTMLYGMPVDRRVFTGAPLAARDFAFVCADAGQVLGWSEAEQRSLESFMLAGGRLCLYNMPETWRGFSGSTDSNVGRGFLLAVPGGYGEAQRRMRDWVGGELEEFILLAGGSVRGYSVPGQAGESVLGNFGLQLQDVYGRDSMTGTLPSTRPGYLHPVWLYRELCSDNAVEPWDFPEYQLRRPRSSGQLSESLRLDSVVDLRSDRHEELLDAAVPPRPFPWQLPAALLLSALPMLVLSRRRRFTAPLCAGLGLLLLASWYQARPLDFQPVRLRLLDRDYRVEPAASRRLSVLLANSEGQSHIVMPPGALVRRVVASPPVRFSQQSSNRESDFSSRGRAESVNLYVDAVVAEPPQFPVEVSLDQQAGFNSLSLDLSSLAAEQLCVLQTPLGYQLLEAGDGPVTINLSFPRLPVHPGLERIRVLRRMHEGGSGQGNPNIARFGSMLSGLRSQLAGSQQGSLSGLCWEGLLRQPYGLLGANQNQAVLMVVDTRPLESGGVEEITVQRFCLPLEGS